MGVSIHYRGKLQNLDTIYALIEEVRDIAEVMGWKYKCMDDDWQLLPSAHLESARDAGIRIVGSCGLKGIQFAPAPLCEYVWLYFNAKGILTSPFRVALDAEEGYPMQEHWLATKTQHAGVEPHIAIVKLLRYLKSKYILDLQVEDEGDYWDGGDPQKLQECFDTVDTGLRAVNQAVERANVSFEDSTEEVVRKIEEALRKNQSDPSGI